MSVEVIAVVGAHNGETAISYANSFPHATVYCFEPDPRNLAALHARLRSSDLLDRTQVHPLAITDSDGRVVLNRFDHSATNSVFVPGRVDLWDGPVSHLDSIEVDCRSLDSWFAEQAMSRVDILHCDVQGAELLVLQGARELLSRSDIGLLRLETEFEPLYFGQPLIWEVGAYLAHCGYRLLGFCDVVRRGAFPGTIAWADSLWAPVTKGSVQE